ncbi:MAG: Fic family protein [Patescibacteria group bacterium]|mgnify:CR=1 FL=1
MARTPHGLNQIKSLREQYYKVLPGKESLINIINEAEIPEHVYNSNAIENSTLTLEETEKILLQIDLDRFVNERELFEAKNLARVTEYIESKARESELSTSVMLLLHKMLLANIHDDIAGRFRRDEEWVRVGTHIGADPKDIERLITGMLAAYHGGKDGHIVARIARLHLTFEDIHPFCDGNGRIGRVLNNYELIREGYVPINIAFVNRARYYDAFQEYEKKGSTNIMEEIVARSLANSYHKRLAYLEGKTIISLNEYAKRHNLSHSNLLNKAGRQTIPAFLEKGVWKIAADAKV